MNHRKFFPFIVVVLLLGLTAACSQASTSTPAPLATATPVVPTVTPTNTEKPTSTPRPTATPNLAATQQIEDARAHVQSYVDAGYLESMSGKLVQLDDYHGEMAKIGYLDYGSSGFNDQIKDFAVWSKVKWENAGQVVAPYYSGCGFSFRIDGKTFDGYTAMVTTERVLLTYCNSSINRCGEIGKTRGAGVLKMSNPAEATMEMVVRDSHAYVLINGEFIGEYTLFEDKLIDPGYLIYSIISGTNRDFGTRCEITDTNVWVVK
jgi:hypothetical protein